jgi:hypothetical protein
VSPLKARAAEKSSADVQRLTMERLAKTVRLPGAAMRG